MVFIFTSICLNATANEKYKASQILENPMRFNDQQVSIIGRVLLNHFEDVNIGGIKLDWACYDKNNEGPSSKASWARLKRWRDSGLNGMMAEVNGTLVFDEDGKYSMQSHRPILMHIGLIRFGSKKIVVNCKMPIIN